MSKDPNIMSFFEHLEELRKRIFRSLLILLVAFLGCWNYHRELYLFLARPLTKFMKSGSQLAFTSLTEPFMMYIKLSFLASLFAASPFLFYQLWRFISPVLKPREKRWALPFILFGTLFFLAGGFFGYSVVFPLACRFFLQIGGDFTPVLTVSQYLSLATKVLLGIALTFELPVLIFFLARFGLVTPKFLLRSFRYFVVIAFVVAALITPTPDMVTQSLVAVPLILLYLLGILIAWAAGKRPTDKPS